MGIGLLSACGAQAQLTGATLTATGNDTTTRYFHAASTLPDGKIMVSGGLGLTIVPPTLISRYQVSFFNPATGIFSSTYSPINGGAAVMVTLLTARSSHTQTTLRDGRVLITGGNIGASGTSPGSATASVEIFNPFTAAMAAGAVMSQTRAYHSATLLPDGRVVVAGSTSWQIFDPASNTWSAAHALARTRVAHAAVLLPDFAGTPYDDRVLLVGGGGTGPATLELLDPVSGATSLRAATLTIGVDDVAATRLPGGDVFIVGGQNVANGDTVPNTYVYDPVGDVIAAGPPTPNRAGGISDHQLIRWGPYVYILGGEEQASNVDTELNYAALYDATSNAWLADGTMNFVHDDFAAAPMGPCTALIIDGGVPQLGTEFPSNRTETIHATLVDACILGDYDNDVDADHRDYDAVGDCLTGPYSAVSPPFVAFRCHPADLDADGDIDLADFADFQALAGSD